MEYVKYGIGICCDIDGNIHDLMMIIHGKCNTYILSVNISPQMSLKHMCMLIYSLNPMRSSMMEACRLLNYSTI